MSGLADEKGTSLACQRDTRKMDFQSSTTRNTSSPKKTHSDALFWKRSNNNINRRPSLHGGFICVLLFLVSIVIYPSDASPSANDDIVSSSSSEQKNEQKKVAIVTLLTTSNYVPGALVLAESLKSVLQANKNGETVLLWVGPEDDPRSDLTGDHIAQLERYWDRTIQLSKKNGTYTECRISAQQRAMIDQTPTLVGLDRYWGTCSKFAVWTLTDYDVVVYMDADSIAINNFDFVFDYVGGDGQGAFAAHGVPECWEDPPQCENFYTAFMVIQPLPNVQPYFHSLAQEQYLAEGEITLLNKVIQQWKPLPRFTLCAQTEAVRPADASGNHIDWTQVKVYDFAGAPDTKPWISHKLAKERNDPYAHGYFGSIGPDRGLMYERYMVPQLLWNQYYDEILAKEAQYRKEQNSLKEDL